MNETTPLFQVEKSVKNAEESTIPSKPRLPLFQVTCMLSLSLSWGFIVTTMVLLVLPLECERISSTMGAAEFKEEDKATASLYLGLFVFLAGLTQLICPIVGKLSDESPVVVVKYSTGRKGDLQDYIWGKRLPYIVLGSVLSFTSLLMIQYASRSNYHWVLFGFSLTIFMIGMNTIYSSMIALVPDLIPDSQVGQANGILALQMVVGSLSGFAAFYWLDSFHMNNHLNDDIIGELVYDMYFVYIVVLCLTTLTTLVFTREKPQGPDKQERENIIEEAKTEPSKDKESPEYSSIIFGLLHVWKVSLKSISHLKMEDILTTYKITPKQHGDFFYATISRALYYMGIVSESEISAYFLIYIDIDIHPNLTILYEPRFSLYKHSFSIMFMIFFATTRRVQGKILSL